MTRQSVSRLLASVAIGAALFMPQTAFAQAARDKVIAIFDASVKAAGAKDITHESATGDDAKFTITGVEISGPTDDDTATVEAVTFIGAKPTADGGITADEINFSGLEISDKKGGLTVSEIKIKGFVGPAPANITKPTGVKVERFEATEIEFGDQTMSVPIASLLLTSADYVDGMPHKGTVDMKGLVVPVNEADPQMKDIAALGYKELAIDANFAVNWDDKAGRLAFNDWTISGKDAGVLKVSLALQGVTAEVMKQIQAAKGDSSQMLGIVQALSLESASVRIDNNSLFERALDAQAKQQGVKKEELLHQATATIPLLLTSIQNPAFEKKINDALTAFLTAPKSLTVAVKPAQPVSVAQIIGTASAAPQTLPDVLSADVSANK